MKRHLILLFTIFAATPAAFGMHVCNNDETTTAAPVAFGAGTPVDIDFGQTNDTNQVPEQTTTTTQVNTQQIPQEKKAAYTQSMFSNKKRIYWTGLIKYPWLKIWNNFISPYRGSTLRFQKSIIDNWKDTENLPQCLFNHCEAYKISFDNTVWPSIGWGTIAAALGSSLAHIFIKGHLLGNRLKETLLIGAGAGLVTAAASALFLGYRHGFGYFTGIHAQNRKLLVEKTLKQKFTPQGVVEMVKQVRDIYGKHYPYSHLELNNMSRQMWAAAAARLHEETKAGMATLQGRHQTSS
jgi:hypothetical protein